MPTLNIWSILGILAIVLLILFAKTKGAVWGGLAGGIVVGLVLATIFYVSEHIFPWAVLMKAAIIGVLAGSVLILRSQLKKR